jgi:hypothetical protein
MPPKKDEEKKEEDPMKSLLKLSVKYANSKAFQDLSDTRISAEQVFLTLTHTGYTYAAEFEYMHEEMS